MDHKLHQHVFDSQGRQVCCTQEEKINRDADKKIKQKKDECCDHSVNDEHEEDDHDHSSSQRFNVYISAILFLAGIGLDQMNYQLLVKYQREIIYGLSYILVAFPVYKEAVKAFGQREFFSEFTLMALATLGAMAIGEYPEAVAVMLFYSIGEIFQTLAVSRAKASIKSLLDLRSNSASVMRDGTFEETDPKSIRIGEIIQVRNGESVALDGTLDTQTASMNTAALTGESAPREFTKGDSVLAGMINQGSVIQVKVEKLFAESSISKILDMVQNASSRKAKTELLIRRFAKIYTPIVFVLALCITFVPYFFVENYTIQSWLYRGLVFLVISCPCALVISIPLGYFGGIGAASRNGILFKGSNYIDAIAKVTHVVMDKTGTLTTGKFEVQDVKATGIDDNEFLKILGAMESGSTHPIASAITAHAKSKTKFENAKDVKEISGHGLRASFDGRDTLVGNGKLLKSMNIPYPNLDAVEGSIVLVAQDGKYLGYANVADAIKDDAKQTIEQLRKLKINSVMLSGDKNSVTQKVAKTLGLDAAFGDLLPQDKVKKVEDLKTDPSRIVAFVGDGINDAPVLALSDVGIAMGAMGSDAAIETANVVIQDDKPSKIVKAIAIAKATRQIVIQNIVLAFAVKAVVLVLGAGGVATMWEAVFADVGVTFLAILNAMRIQRKVF